VPKGLQQLEGEGEEAADDDKKEDRPRAASKKGGRGKTQKAPKAAGATAGKQPAAAQRCPAEAVVKGDGKVVCIAAASIIAKVRARVSSALRCRRCVCLVYLGVG